MLLMSNYSRIPEFTIIQETEEYILIKDIGDPELCVSITYNPDYVITQLDDKLINRELRYIDRSGETDTILVTNGKFTGFKSFLCG